MEGEVEEPAFMKKKYTAWWKEQNVFESRARKGLIQGAM